MPIPVITVAQMREWEKATWGTGQTESEVIRLVGQCAAQHALRLTESGARILLLLGKGNNGADVRAMINHLQDRAVDVLEVRSPSEALPDLGNKLSPAPDLIVDGLFGIGLNRPLSSEWITLIETINAANAKTMSLDVPSGLNAETSKPEGTAIRADVTLTVGAPKLGMLRESAVEFLGRLEVAESVGLIPCPFQSDLNCVQRSDFNGFPPKRRVSGHKGTYGHVAIVAGSVGYHGAAVLAARGSQRAQPGLITVYTMDGAYVPIASQLQAVMVSPWKSSVQLPKSCTGLVVGPGLAADDLPGDLKPWVQTQWRESSLAMLADASALAWLPPGPIPSKAPRLITPHPGEASRLIESDSKHVQADRPKALRELSKRFGDCWVVLKGHQTLIGRSSESLLVNCSGNPYLAQGGSGDTLSGFLGGLLAQPALQENPQKTISYGVWQHGAAADGLQASRRAWVVEDLINELGSVRAD